MSKRRVLQAQALGRRIAQGYAAAAVLLLVVLALRAATVEAWLGRSLAAFLLLALSFRSALVYAYRRSPSALSWLLQPTPIAESEFTATWLVYAVAFGAASLALVLI